MSESYLDMLDRKIQAGLQAAGDELVAQIKINIGKAGATSPGDYPSKVTGRLQASITGRVTEREYIARADAPYAADVAKTRPFMGRTLVEHAPAIIEAFKNGAASTK